MPQKPRKPRARKKTGIEKAVEAVGSQLKLATELDVSPQAVFNWVKQGYVPTGRILEIEKRYGIDRTELIDPKLLRLLRLPDDEE